VLKDPKGPRVKGEIDMCKDRSGGRARVNATGPVDPKGVVKDTVQPAPAVKNTTASDKNTTESSLI